MKQRNLYVIIAAVAALTSPSFALVPLSSTVPFSESFEGYVNGADIDAISSDWIAEAGGSLAATNENPAGFFGGYPLSNSTHDVSMAFDDGASILVDGECEYNDDDTVVKKACIDFLIRPTFARAAPNVVSDAQFALYFDTNGVANLYHTYEETFDQRAVTQKWTQVTNVDPINTGDWVRVTCKVVHDNPHYTYFKMWINGEAVSSTYGYTDDTFLTTNGNYFINADCEGSGNVGATKINSFEVYGPGVLDDVVISPQELEMSIDAVSPSFGVFLGGYPVTITGTDLGNGWDVTNVTLNGQSAVIVSQSSTKLVVTAAATAAGTGDVVVQSASYGSVTLVDGFTYEKATQTLSGFVPTNRAVFFASDTVALSATASSGLPVSFANIGENIVSWQNATSVIFSTYGTATLVATQVGNVNYKAAPALTNVWTIHGVPQAGSVRFNCDAGGTFKIHSTALLSNTVDPENSALTLASVGSLSAQGGFIWVDGDWICYNPPAGFSGSDSFSFSASNQFGADDRGTAILTVLVDGVDGHKTLSLQSLAVSGERVSIDFSGTADSTYAVQATESLSDPDWADVGKIEVEADGSSSLIISNGLPHCFYRTLQTQEVP